MTKVKLSDRSFKCSVEKMQDITGLRKNAALNKLIEVYELRDIQTIIKQFKKLQTTASLTPAQLVEIKVLRNLLNQILD